MSKSPKDRKKRRDAAPVPAPVSDGSIYFGILLIGGFGILMFTLFSQGDMWREATLGFAAAICFLISRYTWLTYQGVHLANWKRALARIPLRFLGYGRKGGKPVEAAHDDPRARNAVIIFAAASAVILFGLAVWLFELL